MEQIAPAARVVICDEQQRDCPEALSLEYSAYSKHPPEHGRSVSLLASEMLLREIAESQLRPFLSSWVVAQHIEMIDPALPRRL